MTRINVLHSNRYSCVLETCKVYDLDNEVTVSVKNNKKYVTLDWIDGNREYELAYVLMVTYGKFNYPIDVLKELKVGYTDKNSLNCFVNNLYVYFQEPIPVTLRPGFYYIPYYSSGCINREGVVIRFEDGKELVQNIRKYASTDIKNRTGGYIAYRLTPDIGSATIAYRHRLLLMTFSKYDTNPANLVVDHINGIPGDDRLENLEFVTKAVNNKRAIDNGLCPNSLIKVHYFNWRTKEEAHYPSIVKAAENTKLTYSAITKRIKFPTKRYLDGHCYKIDDGLPFELEHAIHSTGVEADIVAKNILTGEIIIAPNATKLSELINVSATSITTGAKDKTFKPIKQYIFKYLLDDIDFPEFNFEFLESVKHKLCSPIIE